MLARKRASDLMPNERSSSRFSSNRCFWASVRIEYASFLVSTAVKDGLLRGTSRPSMRMIGGELVVTWRSVPPFSTIVLSS